MPKKPTTPATNAAPLRIQLRDANKRIKELESLVGERLEAMDADAMARHVEVTQKLEQLINTFTFHNNSMVTAMNVMNAGIANLKIGKAT